MKESFIGFDTIYGHGGGDDPYLTRLRIGRLRLHIFHRGDLDPDPHDHPWDFWTFPLTAYVEEVAVKRLEDLSEYDPFIPRPMTYGMVQQIVPAFRWSFRPAEHTHRVVGRYEGYDLHDWPGKQRGEPPKPVVRMGAKIVTIVWQGWQWRKWGFLKNRDGKWCWTPWRDYVFGGGKHAPCEPVERER